MLTKLKAERMKRGLRQTEMAKTMKLSPTTLCALETRRLAARGRYKAEIENLLEIPASELFEDNGLARLQ